MAPSGARGSVVWRTSWLRLPLAAAALGLSLRLLSSGAVPFALKLVVIGIGVLTLVAPGKGLVIAAAVAPLAHVLEMILNAPAVRMAETIVLAFIGAWLLRGLEDRRGPRIAAASVGWLVGVVIAVSIARVAFQLRRFPDSGVLDAAGLLEGLALAAATVTLFRQQPRLATTLPASLATSGAIAAVVTMIGLARNGAAAHVADPNAAGTYFLMLLCLVVGMTLRAGGRFRIAWSAIAAAIALGLAVTALQMQARDIFRPIGAGRGLVAPALVLGWIAIGLARTVRALRFQPRDLRLVGAAIGVVAFLGACAATRPLLVSEVAFPFWIQFGLMTALAGSTLMNAAPTEEAG